MRVLAVPLAVLIVVGLSGCFLFRGFNWATKRLDAGHSTFANVTVGPVFTENGKDIPFTLVGLPSDGNLLVGGKNTWDAKGAFDGPKRMVKDQALADRIINDGLCDSGTPGTGDFSGATWRAVRTKGKEKDHAKVNKTALEKIQIKAVHAIDLSADNPTELVGFITGAWNDTNNDRVPDPAGTGTNQDQYFCSGGTGTFLPIKGNSPAKRQTAKSAAQASGIPLPKGVDPSDLDRYLGH